MFLWGDRTRSCPRAFSRHVHEALPKARQEVLPECGHVPQVELPEIEQRPRPRLHRAAGLRARRERSTRVRAFA